MSNIDRVTKNNNELVPALETVESQLVHLLKTNSLPHDNIFVNLEERATVFAVIPNIIQKLLRQSPMIVSESVYLSKMLAACASGLFDAALNYLWDETVIQLRKRVSQYDLEFFYDSTIGGDKRDRFKTEDDLQNLPDSDLIRGAKEIELIPEIGYYHLEYINRMRNWVSAAHPNQNEITGLQILEWFERCYKEVLSLPIPNVSVNIKQFLNSVKKTPLSNSSSQEYLYNSLSSRQFDRITLALFGIYTREETEDFVRNNIRIFWKTFWSKSADTIKKDLGLKLAHILVLINMNNKKDSLENYWILLMVKNIFQTK
ncbi:MAG: hypothetical protein LBU34_03180 [Planctomycetaceae bacterium]|jgi:hypothetical protein|nr:hypothetical protein [Planctomycetaceae bacterium]